MVNETKTRESDQEVEEEEEEEERIENDSSDGEANAVQSNAEHRVEGMSSRGGESNTARPPADQAHVVGFAGANTGSTNASMLVVAYEKERDNDAEEAEPERERHTGYDCATDEAKKILIVTEQAETERVISKHTGTVEIQPASESVTVGINTTNNTETYHVTTRTRPGAVHVAGPGPQIVNPEEGTITGGRGQQSIENGNDRGVSNQQETSQAFSLFDGDDVIEGRGGGGGSSRSPPASGHGIVTVVQAETVVEEAATATSNSGHSTDTSNDLEREREGAAAIATSAPTYIMVDEEQHHRALALQQERDNAPRAEVLTVEFDAASHYSTTSANAQHQQEQQGLAKAWLCAKRSRRGVTLLTILAVMLVLIGLVVVAVEVSSRNRTNNTGTEQQSEAMYPLPPTAAPASAALPPTIQAIHDRGYVRCFGVPAEVDRGSGFSLEMCSAIAAVVVGDPSRYEMTPLAFQEQWSAVSNGTIDISTFQTINNLQRDVLLLESQDSTLHDLQQGVTFSTPYLYLGLTFGGIPEWVDCAERRDTLVGICRDLTVCVIEGTVTAVAAERILGGSVIQKFTYIEDMLGALSSSQCKVIFGAPTTLYESRVRDFGYTEPYRLATRSFETVPIVFTTRPDDPEFGDMINWMIHALVVAEARNITQATADQFPTTNVFGEEQECMFQTVIAVLGNYGEIYARNWEEFLPRENIGRINAPHLNKEQGGLLYAYPLGPISGVGDDQYQSAGPLADGTLERIEKRQVFKCGIIGGRPGLADWNDTVFGWMGIDVDNCRGVAAALFAGDFENALVLMVYNSLEEGFQALANLEIDALAGAVYSMENNVREPTTGQGFAFGDVYYYHHEDEGINALPLAMATRQHDCQWTDFVRAMTSMSTFHAEANGITKSTAFLMPLIELFGPRYRQAMRDVVLSIGNSAEIYMRNMEEYLPRANNTLNTLNRGDSPMLFANFQF